MHAFTVNFLLASLLHGISAEALGNMLGLGMQHVHDGARSAHEASASEIGSGVLERVYTNYAELPVGEDALRANGWTKHDGKGCHPQLGYAWSESSGGPTKQQPLVLYTTQSGLPAGVGIAIRNEMPEPQLKWTTQNPVVEFQGDDVAYHIDVAFRRSGVCGDSGVASGIGEVLIVNPGGAHEMEIPLTESEARAAPNPWQKGSCYDGMGFHYFLNTKGESPPEWSASDLFPVVPMFHEGKLNAIFFASVTSQITFPLLAANWWEPVSLSDSEMCDNFCGNCDFKDHSGKSWSTMHIYFNHHRDVVCPAADDECVPPRWMFWGRRSCCPSEAAQEAPAKMHGARIARRHQKSS